MNDDDDEVYDDEHDEPEDSGILRLRVTLSYDGNPYIFEQNVLVSGVTEAEWRKGALSLYTEGNYGCDCNRAQFIHDDCGVDVMPDRHNDEDGGWLCGELIHLDRLTWLRAGDAEEDLWNPEIEARANAQERLRRLGLWTPGQRGATN